MSNRNEPLYRIMAKCLGALEHCRVNGNSEWHDVWQELLNRAVEHLPQGGGFDDYPKIVEGRTKTNRLVFSGAYHKMDDVGFYVGWVSYNIIVFPDFVSGFRLSLKGPLGDLREFILDAFYESLRAQYNLDEWMRDARTDLVKRTAGAESKRQEVISDGGSDG